MFQKLPLDQLLSAFKLLQETSKNEAKIAFCVCIDCIWKIYKNMLTLVVSRDKKYVNVLYIYAINNN